MPFGMRLATSKRTFGIGFLGSSIFLIGVVLLVALSPQPVSAVKDLNNVCGCAKAPSTASWAEPLTQVIGHNAQNIQQGSFRQHSDGLRYCLPDRA